MGNLLMFSIVFGAMILLVASIFIIDSLRKNYILPAKSIWILLKLHDGYKKSFLYYFLSTSFNKNIDVLPIRKTFKSHKRRILKGVIIIHYNKVESHVLHLVFLMDKNNLFKDLNLLKSFIGRVETIIFARNSNTRIIYELKTLGTPLKDILSDLGYSEGKTITKGQKIKPIMIKIKT